MKTIQEKAKELLSEATFSNELHDISVNLEDEQIRLLKLGKKDKQLKEFSLRLEDILTDIDDYYEKTYN